MSLLLTYRKLSLVRAVNKETCNLLSIQSEQSRTQEQIGMCQQMKASRDEMVGQIMQNVSSSYMMANQASVFSANQGVGTAQQQLAQAMADAQKDPKYKDNPSSAPGVASAQANLTNAQNALSGQQTSMMFQNYAFQNSMMAAKQMVNSIFAAVDNGQEQALRQKDANLTLRAKSSESLLAKYQTDLKNTEEGEKKSIESESPKFGL